MGLNASCTTRMPPATILPRQRTRDASSNSIKKAERLVKRAFDGVGQLERGKGRSFYAVGGTWRALGRLHMARTGYPLHVMHGYTITAQQAIELARGVLHISADELSAIEDVPNARKPLLAYGAPGSAAAISDFTTAAPTGAGPKSPPNPRGRP